MPSNHDLPRVREVIEAALPLPVDAFEVHNLGLLQVLREMGCNKPIHLGVFGNLYTDATARVVKDYGVTRVYPNPELSLKELIYIRDHTPIEVLVPVHGKIPLVVSETCFIREHADDSPGEKCNFLCAQEHWLTRANGDWSLKDTGRMTLSGSDLCMLEHVPELAAAKLTAFYVQSHGESSDYIAAVGAVYREALTRAFAGEPLGNVTAELQRLSSLAKDGPLQWLLLRERRSALRWGRLICPRCSPPAAPPKWLSLSSMKAPTSFMSDRWAGAGDLTSRR